MYRQNSRIKTKPENKGVEQEFIRSVSVLWSNRRSTGVSLLVDYEFYCRSVEWVELVMFGWLLRRGGWWNDFSITAVPGWATMFDYECIEFSGLIEQSARLVILLDCLLNFEYLKFIRRLGVVENLKSLE